MAHQVQWRVQNLAFEGVRGWIGFVEKTKQGNNNQHYYFKVADKRVIPIPLKQTETTHEYTSLKHC